MKNKKWLYIFTRKDLSPSQIAVQSIHSAFEMGRHYNNGDHPSVVLIKVKNERELVKINFFLKENSFNFKSFNEPYYQNSLTSICLEPIEEDKRSIFKKFQLMNDLDFSKERKYERK